MIRRVTALVTLVLVTPLLLTPPHARALTAGDGDGVPTHAHICTHQRLRTRTPRRPLADRRARRRKRDGSVDDPALEPVTRDEVDALYHDIVRLRAIHSVDVPALMRDSWRAIDEMLDRWRADPGSVSAGEWLLVVDLAKSAGRWRLDRYGFDVLADHRADCVDLYQRLATEARARYDQKNNAEIATESYPNRQIISEPSDSAARGDRSHFAAMTPAAAERRRALGDGIRRLRLARHLTQLELAEQIGTTQGNVSDWERGIHEPYAHVAALVRVLRPANADLAGGEPE